MQVGLHEPLSYARSLARFAANLGPVAWKVASKRIDYVLPPGTQYGPGWVAETGSTPQPPSVSAERQQQPSSSPAGDSKTPEFGSPAPHGLSEEMIEAVRKLNNQNERPSQGGDMSAWKTPFPPVQQKHMYQPQYQRNGFGGMLGYDARADAVGMSRQAVPGHQATEGLHLPPQAMNPMSRTELLSNFSSAMNHAIQEEARLQETSSEMWTFGKSSWPAVPAQQSRSLAVQPDLNLRVPAGSPSSSSLQIGSPQQKQQQPDLALQL